LTEFIWAFIGEEKKNKIIEQEMSPVRIKYLFFINFTSVVRQSRKNLRLTTLRCRHHCRVANLSLKIWGRENLILKELAGFFRKPEGLPQILKSQRSKTASSQQNGSI
jgi:hypothetical protein